MISNLPAPYTKLEEVNVSSMLAQRAGGQFLQGQTSYQIIKPIFSISDGSYSSDGWSEEFSEISTQCFHHSYSSIFTEDPEAMVNCVAVLPPEVAVTAITGTENGLMPGEIRLDWTEWSAAVEYHIFDKSEGWEVGALESPAFPGLSSYVHNPILARVPAGTNSFVLEAPDICQPRGYVVTVMNALGRESIGLYGSTSHVDPVFPTFIDSLSQVVATPGPGIGDVTVRWEALCPVNWWPGYRINGFNVYRWDGTLYQKINTSLIPYTDISFLDGGLPPGDYQYVVSFVDKNGIESSFSAPAIGSAGTGFEPTLPRGLTTTKGPGPYQITLTWNTNPESNMDHYLVYRKAENGTTFDEIGSVVQPPGPFVDTLGDFLKYQYKIQAVALENTFFYPSSKSPPVEEVANRPLSPPQNLIVTPPTQDFGHYAEVQWCPNDPIEDIVEYKIYSGGLLEKTTTQTHFMDFLAGPCGTYYYEVSAINRDGQESSRSIINGAYTCSLCVPGEVSNLDPEEDVCAVPPSCSPGALNLMTPDTEIFHLADLFDSDSLENPDSKLSGLNSPLIAPQRYIGQAGPTYTISFHHLDHLGSPRVITDISGNLVSEHHYLPFGEETPAMASPNTHQFTGHERDKETGLDYMLARYYSHQSARFLSRDPGNDVRIGIPQSWNKYAYARNNPLLFKDPTGGYIYNAATDKTTKNYANFLLTSPTIQKMYGGPNRHLKIRNTKKGEELVHKGKKRTGKIEFGVETDSEGNPVEILGAVIIIAPNDPSSGEPRDPEDIQNDLRDEFGHAANAVDDPQRHAQPGEDAPDRHPEAEERGKTIEEEAKEKGDSATVNPSKEEETDKDR